MTGRALLLLLALAGTPGTWTPQAVAAEPAASAAPAATPAAGTPPNGSAPAAADVAAPSAPALPGGGTARPLADDPELEKRLMGLTRELRCLVCQNESIADSHAPLAVDMRNEIREQLRAGMTDREVIDFMVARYGNFVRFRPPLDATTLALWFGPALLLLAGLGALLRQLLRRRALAEAAARAGLSEAERAALARTADPAASADAPPAGPHYGPGGRNPNPR